MKVEEIETAFAAKRQRQTELKAELVAIDDQAATMRETYKTAVENGEAEDKLDAMDQTLYKLDREQVRIKIRLDQCNREIEGLQAARHAALAEARREEYHEILRTASKQAERAEEAAQKFYAEFNEHGQTIAQARQYLESVGVTQIPFSTKHLERRMVAILNGNHSTDQVYKKPYPEILRANIASIERQLNDSTPIGEATDGVAEQQAAVND